MAFRFLKSLFSVPDTVGREKYDPALIEAAIERVVEGTDPRLRAVSRYRQKLWEAVTHAVEYVVQLIDCLPPPVEANHRSFTATPTLRAAFASPDQLRETVSFSKHIRDYWQKNPGPLPPELYGVLGMERVEKTVLGVELVGEMLRRDVRQIAVNFCNHRFAFPSEREQHTRQALMKRAFDSLIESALTQLTTTRLRRRELEHQQRQLLQKKAIALKSGQMGLGSLFAWQPLNQAESAILERQLLDIQEELRQLHTDSATIEHLLEQVAAALWQPEHYLRLEQVTLTLDHMNIKTPPDSPRAANAITFNEAVMGVDRRLTVLLVRFPSDELLPQPDFLEEAHRLLTPRLMT